MGHPLDTAHLDNPMHRGLARIVGGGGAWVGRGGVLWSGTHPRYRGPDPCITIRLGTEIRTAAGAAGVCIAAAARSTSPPPGPASRPFKP